MKRRRVTGNRGNKQIMDKQTKNISVIIPVYNSEATVKRCLDSVAAQTFKSYEVIIVDDGSNDGSARIIDAFCESNAGFRCIRTKNRGVAAARNTGMEVATGDYIAFVDSDDSIRPDMLEKMYAAAVKTDADVTVCRYAFNKIKDQGLGRISLIGRESMIHEMMLPAHDVASFIFNRLYKRAFLEDNRIRFNEKISVSEDLLFNAECVLHGSKNAFLDSVLYCYIINENGTMFSKGFNRKKLSANDTYDIMFDKDMSAKEMCYAKAACSLYNVMLYRQCIKYRADISGAELRNVKAHLCVGERYIFKTHAPLKYKLGFIALKYFPWVFRIV